MKFVWETPEEIDKALAQRLSRIRKRRNLSQQALIENDRYPEIHHGIKLTGGNIGFSDNVYTFPYFCTFLMKRYLKSDPFNGLEER